MFIILISSVYSFTKMICCTSIVAAILATRRSFCCVHIPGTALLSSRTRYTLTLCRHSVLFDHSSVGNRLWTTGVEILLVRRTQIRSVPQCPYRSLPSNDEAAKICALAARQLFKVTLLMLQALRAFFFITPCERNREFSKRVLLAGGHSRAVLELCSHSESGREHSEENVLQKRNRVPFLAEGFLGARRPCIFSFLCLKSHLFIDSKSNFIPFMNILKCDDSPPSELHNKRSGELHARN